MDIGAGWLNLGSLALGLAAWTLPLIGIVRRGKPATARALLLCVCSMGACALSLCLQLFYSSHLVQKADWSALMDTASAVASVGLFLVISTMILNAVSIYFQLKRKGV